MTHLWTTGDLAHYIGRSTQTVKNYLRGQGVETPPPSLGVLTNGAHVYDPEQVQIWWAQELTARAGGVPYDALHA